MQADALDQCLKRRRLCNSRFAMIIVVIFFSNTSQNSFYILQHFFLIQYNNVHTSIKIEINIEIFLNYIITILVNKILNS